MLSLAPMERKSLAVYLLCAGLALVFIAFGVWKFTEPVLWYGFLPGWMSGGDFGMSRDAWLIVLGVIEIALGVMLILPVQAVRKTAAAIIVLHLMVVVWQVGWNDVGVRDIGLLFSAGALWMLL